MAFQSPTWGPAIALALHYAAYLSRIFILYYSRKQRFAGCRWLADKDNGWSPPAGHLQVRIQTEAHKGMQEGVAICACYERSYRPVGSIYCL